MSLTLIIGNKNYSSWSLRPWLFLRHHGIPFDEVRISLYRQDSKSRIEAHSPSGKVPALRDDGVVVWDSLAILEYLAERFPNTSGWPGEIGRRATARAYAAEMHSGFQALREHCGMNCRREPGTKDLPATALKDAARVAAIWEACRTRYADEGPWLFGDFGIVDAMYAPVVLRFNTYALTAGPLGRAYIETVLNHRPVVEWVEAGKRETEIIQAFED